VLQQRFETLRRQHEAEAAGTARKVVADPRAYDLAGLNAEAIQICQLSLWIKTAARGKQLTSLYHTIREGNGVISEKAWLRSVVDFWHAKQVSARLLNQKRPKIRKKRLLTFRPRSVNIALCLLRPSSNSCSSA
jgi:hypothetical protein